MIKKALLLLALVLGTLSASAQSIIYDQTSSNGVRTLICNGLTAGDVDGVNVNVALAGFDYKGSTLYSLAVVVGSSHPVTIPTGSKCILTLANGKSYELETVSGGTAVLQNMDVQMGQVYQSYQRFAYYNIKKSTLKKLKNGVASLQIQLRPSNYVTTFSSDVLGTLFTASKEVIDETFDQ